MTRRTRAPSEDERALFEDTLKDAAPLRKPARPRAKAAPVKPATPAAPQSAIVSNPLPPKPLRRPHKPSGLDGNTAERLRKGLLEPQARIDLHGLTEAAAHRALVTFVIGARARDLRLVLVVTGKGAGPAPPDAPFDLAYDSRPRGVLKTMTPRWLAEPELAAFVADVRAAHNRHGGAGALYVYLRKR
jgi:DNA-nicking Smr family endonuclease